MATRKQLKRERKRRTHGIERAAPSVAERAAAEPAPSNARRWLGGSRDSGSKPSAGKSSGGKASGSRSSGLRKPVAYPTITRALKRAPLLAGVWFVLIEFVFKPSGSSTTSNLLTTALIAAVMVPAMYLTDRFAYRMALKRGAPVEPPPGAAS